MSWPLFVARRAVPVNLQQAVSFSGDAITPIDFVDCNLPCQPILKRYHGYINDLGVSYAAFTNGSYYQLDFNDEIILDEVKQRYTLPRLDNTELPAANFILELAGGHVFDIRIIASTFTVFNAESVKDPTDMIDFYIQFNNESPIPFSWTDETIGSSVHTVFTYNGSHDLRANTMVRIYGKANTTSAKDLNILGGASTGFSGSSPYASYCKIDAHTTFPSSSAQGYLLHDAFAAVVQGITGRNCFYSEYLGSTQTVARQYPQDGCGWKNFITAGLQIRGYTFDEKSWAISFDKLWDCAAPLLFLGCSYDTIDGEEVIRVENLDYFYQL